MFSHFSSCQLKCCLELILESEQLQVLAEYFPRNTTRGKNFHPLPSPGRLHSGSRLFSSKIMAPELTRTVQHLRSKARVAGKSRDHFFVFGCTDWVLVAVQGLSLLAKSRGHSLLQGQASRCHGFACCRARAHGL